MSNYINQFQIALVPLINGLPEMREKRYATNLLLEASRGIEPSHLNAIRIIADLGEKLSLRLQGKKNSDPERASKVTFITAAHVNAISASMLMSWQTPPFSACVHIPSEEHVLSRAILAEASAHAPPDSPLHSPPLKREHVDDYQPEAYNVFDNLPSLVMRNIFRFVPPTTHIALSCKTLRSWVAFCKTEMILENYARCSYSLSDFGLVIPERVEEPPSPSALHFLQECSSFFAFIKKQLPKEALIQINREKPHFSTTVKTVYDYNLFLLFQKNQTFLPLSFLTREAITEKADSLRGEIPTKASGFISLEYCGTDTPLTCMPKAIRHCKNLETLSIHRCLLRKIPDEIEKLEKLQSLCLQRNSLTSLPEALGKCTSLRSLDVTYNLLQSLPSSVLALPRLIHLEIDEDVQLPSGYEQTHVVFRIPRDAIFDRRFPNESLAEYRKKLTDIAS